MGEEVAGHEEEMILEVDSLEVDTEDKVHSVGIVNLVVHMEVPISKLLDVEDLVGDFEEVHGAHCFQFVACFHFEDLESLEMAEEVPGYSEHHLWQFLLAVLLVVVQRLLWLLTSLLPSPGYPPLGHHSSFASHPTENHSCLPKFDLPSIFCRPIPLSRSLQFPLAQQRISSRLPG